MVDRRIRVGGSGDPWWPVVGVVDDTYVGSPSGGFGLGTAPVPQLYLSWGVQPYPFADLVVRTRAADPLQQLPLVRDVLAQLAPTVPLQRAGALEQAIRDSTWAFTLFSRAFSVFGVVTVLMATVGLFSVMAFGVQQRTREMGVRIALGASGAGILGLVARMAGGQVLGGLVLRLILSGLLGRSLRLLLFDVTATEPVRRRRGVAAARRGACRAWSGPDRDARQSGPRAAGRVGAGHGPTSATFLQTRDPGKRFDRNRRAGPRNGPSQGKEPRSVQKLDRAVTVQLGPSVLSESRVSGGADARPEQI